MVRTRIQPARAGAIDKGDARVATRVTGSCYGFACWGIDQEETRMNKPAFQLAGTVITAALTASGCVSTGEFEKVQADKAGLEQQTHELQSQRRRSEERRVGKSVDLGGRRIIKKKKRKHESP